MASGVEPPILVRDWPQGGRAFSMLGPAHHVTGAANRCDGQKHSMLFPGCPQLENHKFLVLYQQQASGAVRGAAEEDGPWGGEALARTRCEPGRFSPTGQGQDGEVARDAARRSSASPASLGQWGSKGRKQGLKPSPRGTR